MGKKIETTEELDLINQKLIVAAEYGLQAEVTLFALRAMKADPENLSPIEALCIACQEWDI